MKPGEQECDQAPAKRMATGGAAAFHAGARVLPPVHSFGRIVTEENRRVYNEREAYDFNDWNPFLMTTATSEQRADRARVLRLHSRATEAAR